MEKIRQMIRLAAIGLLSTMVVLVSFGVPTQGATLVSGLGGARDYGENVFPGNDDGSIGPIDITPVFGAGGLNFFGAHHTAVYVNNNGNITFNGGLGTYTPFGIPSSSLPIIAAFFADVDTRGAHSPADSNLVYYDVDSVAHIFTATWDLVGYYGGHTDKLNAFQIRLIDQGSGDFDIEFRYAQLQWTTGDASNGAGGLGGQPARAGYSAGDQIHYYEFPESGSQNDMLDLVNRTNESDPGVFVLQVRGGTPYVCGNGILETGEPCDEGMANGSSESCCNADCTLKIAGTECRPAAGDCDAAEHCTGSSPACPADMLLPANTPCAPDTNDCTKDICDGNGVACTHPNHPMDEPCGDPSDTACDNPDTCDGAGTCQANHEAANAPCGDPSNTACTQPDSCDGNGGCLPNDAPANTPCGDPSSTECTNPDTCNGSGVCLPNHRLAGTPCGDHSDSVCDNPDTCNGLGTCQPNNEPNGTPCAGSNNNTCLNTCQAATCTSGVVPNCCGNGTLDPGELCDDGNQVNGDECSTACRLNLDHFQCYRTLVLTPQPPIGMEVLVDQFHTINAHPGQPKSICNPANKNDEDPAALTHPAHLETYPIRVDPRKDIAAILPIRNLKVVNQFGTLYVDAVQVKEQLVPTAKEFAALPPPLVAPTLDHFTCYRIKRSKNHPRFTPIHNVAIQDQFGSMTVTVRKPSRLCLPTNHYNDEPGAENHIAHLMCYRVAGLFSTPGRVFTNNPFGPGQLYVRFPNELCVPSVKNPT